jgi:hypothetical protein
MLLVAIALAIGAVLFFAAIGRPTKQFTDDSADIKQFTNARNAILKKFK